jgi:hypothetical protein
MTYTAEIKLDQLTLDEGLQPRSMMQMAVVDEYAEAMQDGAVFPAITVYLDGDLGTYWVADGFHRVAAARHAGRATIEAEIRDGDRREALLWSVQANATHGLRRSNLDKRRAVLALLEDQEWRTWSDREIARRTATSHAFVARVRELTGYVSSERRYVDRHGNVVTMDTAPIAESNEARAAESVHTETLDDPSPGDEPAEDDAIDYASIEEIQAGIERWLDVNCTRYDRNSDTYRERMAKATSVWPGSLQREAGKPWRHNDMALALAYVREDIRKKVASAVYEEELAAAVAELDLDDQMWVRMVLNPRWPSTDGLYKEWRAALYECSRGALGVAAEFERTHMARVIALRDIAERWSELSRPAVDDADPLPHETDSRPTEAAFPQDVVLSIRIAGAITPLPARKVLLTVGAYGQAARAFYRGGLVELHDMIERAVAEVLGDEARAVVRGEVAPLPAGEPEREPPDQPFEIGSVVQWGSSYRDYGRVENYSSSGKRVYVLDQSGERRAFPVQMLRAAETEEA